MNSDRALPCPFNSECGQARSLAFIEVVLDEPVNAASTRSLAQASTQFGEIFGRPGGNNFDIAILGIAHPPA